LNLRVKIECSVSGAACLRRCVAAGPAWPTSSSYPGHERALDQIAPPDMAPALRRVRRARSMGRHPGSNVSNPLPSPAEPAHLIWTGFQPTATGSRVFFRLRASGVRGEEGHLSKGGHSTLTVLLRGCRINLANNRRKLDTRAFPRRAKHFGQAARQGRRASHHPSRTREFHAGTSRAQRHTIPRFRLSAGQAGSIEEKASRSGGAPRGPHRVTAGRFPATVTQ